MEGLEELDSIFEREGFELVYLYGSRATGKAYEESDVDIGFIAEDPEEFDFRRVARLEREMSDKIGEKVDLRVLNGKDTRFLYNVIREGDLIYKSDEQERQNFEHCLMRNYLDLKPFYREYDRNVRESVTG